MLAYIRSGGTSGTYAHSYLPTPDVNEDKWETRGNDEVAGFLCDKKIKLTEELKIYLLYFAFTSGKNICHSLTSFSNLPIKEEQC